MTHFSETEFVDLIEGALEPRRAAHADTCAACRDQAAALGVTLRDTAAVDVPEPSPLFWKHLRARVHAAVDAEPLPATARWSWSRLLPLAAAAALVFAVYSGRSLRELRDGQPPAPLAVPAVADARVDGTPDPADAEVWEVLTSAAASVALDDVSGAGMRAHPAAIDHAVQGLSNAELTELGRLLQSELKRSSN